MNRFRPLAIFALCLTASAAALAKPQVHRPPNARHSARKAALVTPDASGTNVVMPHLTWCGGRVLTSTKIVAVFWGPPDALAATTACQGSTFKECIDSYLTDLVNDPQFDWIDEYQTPTGQTNGGLHISRATYSGSYQITPANTATTIGESATETELSAQIQAGHLPADDSQTIYEVFFPLTVFPSDGANSGNVGCCDFCAYHDSYNSNVLGKELMFGIFPSAVPGGYSGTCPGETYTPDCSGCGERADWFQNLGGSVSHEIFETITDPDIGLAGDGSGCDPEIGWYDNNNSDAMSAHGEVADMCEGFNDADYSNQITEETFSATDGTTYTVQRLWSNAHNACLADDSGAFTINNVTQTTAIKAPKGATTLISLPSTNTLDAGTLPIQYALHYGDYPDAGLPAGITASFEPASPATGQNTVMALTLANSAATTSFTFGVSAENGISQAQTVVKISATGVTAPDAGTPGNGAGGGSAGGSGGGSAGGSGGGSAGGSGGGSAGGSGGGSAGGSGGGSAGGSGGGSAGGSGGGSAGGSGGGSAGGSGGGSAGGSGGGSAGGSGGGSGNTGFTATVSPSQLTLTAGDAAESATLTTHLTSGAGGFTVRASGVTGVTATPTTGTVGTALTLSISAAAGTPSSTGSLSLALTSSGATATVPLALTVSGDDATLTVPSEESVLPGATTTFTVTSATSHGQPQLLALSATGLPAGVTAMFNPPQITSGGTSTATLTATSAAGLGSSPVVIVGQGPVAQVKANLSLDVGTGSSGGCASTDPVPFALLGLMALFGASKRKRARAAIA